MKTSDSKAKIRGTTSDNDDFDVELGRDNKDNIDGLDKDNEDANEIQDDCRLPL